MGVNKTSDGFSNACWNDDVKGFQKLLNEGKSLWYLFVNACAVRKQPVKVLEFLASKVGTHKLVKVLTEQVVYFGTPAAAGVILRELARREFRLTSSKMGELVWTARNNENLVVALLSEGGQFLTDARDFHPMRCEGYPGMGRFEYSTIWCHVVPLW